MARINAFQQYGDKYDEWFVRNADLYSAEIAAIGSFFSHEKLFGLEVGVGSAKFALPLGVKIGVEPSEKMAQKAKKAGISVVKAVAENLPFPESTFDFVLMVTTICFVDDIEQSFKEAKRVLKKGGFIVTGFVDKESELGKIYQAKKDKSKFYKEAVFFSSAEVIASLKKAGFTDIKAKQTLLSRQNIKGIKDGFGEGSFVVIKAFKR